MKLRFPICFYFGLPAAVIYVLFTSLAYIQYPLPFTPLRNWLSDLGNQIDNPQGAAFYNAGVILAALFQAIWFLGLSQWRLEHAPAHQRLLAVAQLSGLLASFALIMSALNPINTPEIHSFWSQIHFMISGIAFGFSVAALRYHPRFSNGILYFGMGAGLLPFFMFAFGKGQIYWLEWIAVGFFLLYILIVGNTSRSISRHA